LSLTEIRELPIFRSMIPLKSILKIVPVLAILCMASTSSGNTINLLTDIKAAYLYEHPDEIDWPLVYYLTQENGCRVELVTVTGGPMFKHLSRHSDRYNLGSSRVLLADTAAGNLDSVTAAVFGEEIPDVVVFSGIFEDPAMTAYGNHLLDTGTDTSEVFYVRKFYRRLGALDSGDVYLKSKQYLENRYNILAQMAEAVSLREPAHDPENIYSIYGLIKNNTAGSDKHSFLSGIDRFKFDLIIGRNIQSAVQRSALGINRKNYVTHINEALKNHGAKRIELLIKAMNEAKKIRQTYYYQVGRVDSSSAVAAYIEKTLASIVEAVFFEARIDYRGNVTIIETPEGRKLKFRGEINNNGYMTVRAGRLDFKPVWSDEAIRIDSVWTDILPNNSLIREYAVNVPQDKLQNFSDRSVKFIGHVMYAGKDIEFAYSSRVVEKSGFAVEMVPDFLIIDPFPELVVDKLVEPAHLKAILNKPREYSGEVSVEVIAPEGIHVGAYPEKLKLHSGETAVEIKIPLAITKSIGDRRRQVIINIKDDAGRSISDMVYVGQCPYEIPSSVTLAVIADRSGVLEDLLMQSDAAYKVLSDRYIAAGDFDYYDAVLIGDGVIDDARAKQVLNDKLKKYIEFGGTVITFGRPEQWGDKILPVSIVPGGDVRTSADLNAKTGNHPLFKEKYRINVPDLLKRAAEEYQSRPAIVFPGERIVRAGSGAAVLTETKLGEGKLIYCGLPLTEMIRNLDTEAVRLFTNLIVYSGN